MGRKPMTEEQKAQAAANLAKARAAKAANKTEQVLPGADMTAPEPAPVETAAPDQGDALQMLVMRLMSEIDELKKQKNPNFTPEAGLETAAQMRGVTMGKNGVQGKIFKYPIETSYYPNPIERLYDEPTLRRFNLRDNFYFDWEVTGTEFEKYNITYAEPTFTCRIFRVMFEEDGITPNGQMGLINRMILHEDEIVARVAAEKLGLVFDADTDEQRFRDLMDEVRFLRLRQWLLDLFTPPTVNQYKRRPRPMVIDGKVVEMYDTESLIDGEAGKSKASTVQQQTRL